MCESPALTATTKRAAPAPRSKATAASPRPHGPQRAVAEAGSVARRRVIARTDRATGVPAPLVPWEGPAVLRIVAAAEPDLVAPVVDARRARERHLEERRQPDARDVRITKDRPQPRGIVRPDQVELDRHDVRVVGRRELPHPIRESGPSSGRRLRAYEWWRRTTSMSSSGPPAKPRIASPSG